VVAVALSALLAVGASAYLLVGYSSSSTPDAKLTACTYDGHSNSTTAHVTVSNARRLAPLSYVDVAL
jgi:YD repeat-containing protein